MSRPKSNCLLNGGQREPRKHSLGVECSAYQICQGSSRETAWRSEVLSGDRRKASQDVVSLQSSSNELVWAETVEGEFVAGITPEVAL
jgi:hypothetical protein